LVIGWSTIASDSDVEALGLTIKRSHVFYFAAAYFLFVNLQVLIWIRRIGNMVQLLDDDHFLSGVSKLTTHPWITNPFIFLGSTRPGAAYSERGMISLIGVWWIPNLTLMALAFATNVSPVTMYLSQGCYLVCGLASMTLILEVWSIVLGRVADDVDSQSTSQPETANNCVNRSGESGETENKV